MEKMLNNTAFGIKYGYNQQINPVNGQLSAALNIHLNNTEAMRRPKSMFGGWRFDAGAGAADPGTLLHRDWKNLNDYILQRDLLPLLREAVRGSDREAALAPRFDFLPPHVCDGAALGLAVSLAHADHNPNISRTKHYMIPVWHLD